MSMTDTEFESFGQFSPFPAMTETTSESERSESERSESESALTVASFGYESPFRGTAEQYSSADAGTMMLESFLGELADEDFDRTLDELADHAAMLEARADERGGVSSGARAWLERLAGEAERSVDSMAAQLATMDLAAMSESEVDRLFEGFHGESTPGVHELEEQFVSGIIRKGRAIVNAASKAIKRGIAFAGRFLPINAVFGHLRSMVRHVIARVLKRAMGQLPTAVQPLARSLAAKLGIQLESNDGEALGEAFDVQLTALTFAEDTFEAEHMLDEAMAEAEDESGDAAAELGDARQRLVEQFVTATPGTNPVAEIEQFVPAVMAAMPLVRVAVKTLGRDRIVRALARLIAPLVATQIGSEAAQRIARPLANVGLRQLGLEVPADGETTIAGEALATTVEETVTAALSMPAEAMADELQLASTVQTAFADAAGRHLPPTLIRGDLAEREVDGANGVWVLMPRHHAPRYRYKKYSQVFAVPISRQVADSVPWRDGGTLQTHLEDEGVSSWPVQAEVHLYETLPGGQLGHLAADETAEAPNDTSEVQPLTEQIAGLLLREPRLGAIRTAGTAAATAAGRARYFRVAVPGMRGRRRGRPRRRATIRLSLGAQPTMRVAFRLSEREGQEIAARLERKDLAGALAWFTRRTGRFGPRVTDVLHRGQRRSREFPVSPDRIPSTATAVVAALAAAMSAELATSPSRLAAAVREPADGVTVVFTVPLAASPPAATTTVAAGWRHW
jgi:hypothetical protein